MFTRFVLITTITAFAGCTGQSLYIPLHTSGVDRQGNKVGGAKAVKIFGNTGNLANVNYNYHGAGGSVTFTADVVDNASTTSALWGGIGHVVQKTGDAAMKIAAVAATAGVLKSASGAASSTTNTSTLSGASVSKNATNAATQVRLAEIAAGAKP